MIEIMENQAHNTIIAKYGDMKASLGGDPEAASQRRRFREEFAWTGRFGPAEICTRNVRS